MSTTNNTVAAISGVLTIGVGGLVAWVKKSLTSLLDEAQITRVQSAKEIAKLQAEITKMKADVNKVLIAVTPAKTARRPVTPKTTKAQGSTKKSTRSPKKPSGR